MKYIVVLSTLCGVALAATRVGPLVSTSIGLIRGLIDDNGHAKFLGVPYGKVGDNLFGVAEPHPAFDDIYEADDDSNVCIQVSPHTGGVPVGTIDCLNMNIYVPDAYSLQRLPVMVWFHGGGFVEGSAIQEASNPLTLLKHDVIVIAVNYRLGVFGFMCLDIPEVPGNTGLKDQALALKWINENIEAFGGDANQITVFGQSAGGLSATLHLFSLNEKLFQRVIIQASPDPSSAMKAESDNSIPFTLAEHLGLTTTDMHEAISYLNTIDSVVIAQAAFDLTIAFVNDTMKPLTKPCIETEFEGVEHFLTEHPVNVMPSKASSTSVLIGYNNNEYAFDYADLEAEFFDTYDFSALFTASFDMEDDLAEGIESVQHFYVGGEVLSDNVRWDLVNYGSDFIVNHPAKRMAQKLLESGALVYSYVFSYTGSPDGMGINKTWSGAGHMEELQYLFDLDENKTAEDQTVIDSMAEIWTNFVKYGDPTPATSELVPVKLAPITETTYPYIDIDLEVRTLNRPFHDRMAFWDVFYSLYAQYQKGYKA